MIDMLGNKGNITQVQMSSGFRVSFLRVAKESKYKFLCAL
jgi:hypothetical protein